MSLSECITILEELYEKDIKIKEACEDESKRFQVPEKLRDFYSSFHSIKMPFGRIYPIDLPSDSVMRWGILRMFLRITP